MRLGPFAYRRDRDGCDDTWDIIDLSREIIVTRIPFWDDDADWTLRSEATARLFVNSTDLLSSLEELVGGWPDADADQYHGAVDRAAVVIAKAMGRVRP